MTAMESREATWLRSSFCASGACLEASRAGRLVLVRDSKQAASTGLIQQWARDEWEDLLHAVKLGAIMTVHHPAIDPHGDQIYFGLHRHETLVFDGATEWAAFVKGVRAGEFEYAKLPTYASTLSSPAPSGGYGAGLAQVGPDFGTRSDQVVTGAGAIAVPPVPVTADPTIGEALCADGIHEADGPCCAPVPVATPASATAIRRALYDSLSPNFEIDSDGYDDAAVAVALLIEAVPVAAQPRYILDAPAILDMVGRYAAACVEAATTGSPKGREDARDQIGDLWDAIRAALTPIPVVEPVPAWGSGPLVEHNPEPVDDFAPYEVPNSCCLSGQLSHGREHSFSCKHNPETPAVSRLRGAADRAAVNGGADPVPTTPGTGSAVPDREEIERRARLAESWAEDD